MRSTWHWDSTLGKLVEGPSPPRIDRNKGVIGELEAFQSPIDGSWIESRKQRRNHMKEHNVIEVGNEKLSPPQPKRDEGNIKQDIYEALNGR